MKYLIIIILQILVISSCSHRDKRDVRLTKVEELVSSSPEEALDSLQVIDYASLSDGNRNYYDFLLIKASDKAGIAPPSDSLILSVIGYASTNKKKWGLYEESVYYGAKVYKDLGDYTAALKYSEKVLELLPEDTKNKELRRNALSLNAKILNELKLYSEAAPSLESAIRYDKELGDTLGELSDFQLLGEIYLKRNDLAKAESCFNEAYKLSQNFDQQCQSRVKMNLALVKYHQNDFDSAHKLIWGVSENVFPEDREHALAIASMIYLKSGMLDSAYIFAKELVASEDKSSRKTGLSVLISPEFRSYVASDSLSSYIGQYRDLVEEMLRENQSEIVQIQQSYYTHSVYQREKEKSESHRFVIAGVILGVMFVVLKDQ